MSDQSAIIQHEGVMPVLSIQAAVARYNAVVEFTKKVMKPGKDFGAIPGTGTKPTLLKPGAEKLCSLFGFVPDPILINSILDFDHGLFYFQYRMDLYRDGKKVGSGIGSCNSREKKYRYRNVAEKKATPEEKAAAIRIETKSGQYGSYKVYVIENTEPFELVNTLDKMAQKRALIAATLIAANASEFFTQDVEDLDILEGEYTEEPPAQTGKPAQPATQFPPDMPEDKAPIEQAEQGNGKSAQPIQTAQVDTQGIYHAVMNANLADSIHSAQGALRWCKTGYDTPEKAIAWMRLYRAWKDLGKTTKEAADLANNGELPK